MTKCFKMVAIEALLESGQLRDGAPLADLAARSHAILSRSPDLLADVAENERVDSLNDDDARRRWDAYWLRNPVTAWTSPKKDRRAWFRLDSDRFAPAFPIEAEDEPHLVKLTRELVDYPPSDPSLPRLLGVSQALAAEHFEVDI